jgi:hypothetical protein
MTYPKCGGKMLWIWQSISSTKLYKGFYECIKCFKMVEDETQEK